MRSARSGVEVLVSNDDGAFYIDSTGEITQLVKGRVAAAVDDTRGGLLFQVDGGRNWDAVFGEERGAGWSTVVWWIPREAAEAQALLNPTRGAGHDLSLHDAYWTDDGFGIVYTRHEGTVPFGPDADMRDRLRTYDVANQVVTDLYSVRGHEWWLDDVSAGGGLVTFTEHQMFGSGCVLLNTKGDPVNRPGIPTSPECFPVEDMDIQCEVSCALSADGARTVYRLPVFAGEEPSDPSWEVEFVVVGTGTGEEVGRVAFDVSRDSWPYEPGVASSWLVVNLSSGQPALLEPLLFDLEDPLGEPVVLPLTGRAHLVERPVSIQGPVIPPTPAAIQLRGDGLGLVDFGDPADQVVGVLAELFGSPPEDPWVSAQWVEYLGWEDLGFYVGFSTTGLPSADPVSRLTGWQYLGSPSHPGIEAEAGIGIGSPVSDLIMVYGESLHLPAEEDECAGWVVNLPSGVNATLGGPPTYSAAVIKLSAGVGVGC